MTLRGHVHKYGVDIDTDVIIPARYLNITTPEELARTAWRTSTRSSSGASEPGDIIVADTNFGCGSSREHAPLAISGAGVSCVVAKSFARIFYRNAINLGLPILECPEAVDGSEAGDELEVDLESGAIRNLTRSTASRPSPSPSSCWSCCRPAASWSTPSGGWRPESRRSKLRRVSKVGAFRREFMRLRRIGRKVEDELFDWADEEGGKKARPAPRC